MKHNLIKNSVLLILNLLLFQTSFAIYIKHQPQNVSINYCGGLEQASFTTIAREGVGTFQWQEDNGLGFEDITNANDSILNIDVTSLGQDGLKFRCIVTSECSNNISDTSDVAYLFVSSIPPPPSVNVTSLLGFGESTTLFVDTSFVLVESACENSNSFIYVFSDLPIYNNYKFQIDNLDGNGFVDYNQITYYSTFFAGQLYDSAITIFQLPQLTSELLTLNNKKLRFATIGGCNNDVFDYSNDITFQVEFTATTGKISLTTYDANGLEHISFDTNSCNLSYPLELFNDIDTCSAIKTLIANCPSNNCDFKLYMYDSNNDGWNGNTMSLLINGNIVQSNISLSSGGTDSLLFPVLDGDEISIIWNGGGSNEEETSYEIFDQNQNIIGIGSQTNIGDGNYFTKWAIKNHNSNSWTNFEGGFTYLNPQNTSTNLVNGNYGLDCPNFWPAISGDAVVNNLFDSLATIRCIVYNGVIQSSDTSFIDVEIKTGDQTLTYGTIDQNVNNQYINHTVDVIGCNFPYDFTMVPNSIQIDVDGVPQNVTPNRYGYYFVFPFSVVSNLNSTNNGFTINSMDYSSFINSYPIEDDQDIELSIDSIFINGYCPIKLNQSEVIEIAKLDIVQELKIEELDSIKLSNSIICSGDTLTVLVNLDSENDNFIEYSLNPDSVRWMVDQGNGIFTPIFTDNVNYIGSTTLELSIISSTDKHNNIYKCVVYEKDCNLLDEIHSNSFAFKNSNKTKIPTIQITESGSRCIGGQLTLSANPSTYTNYNWWIDSLDGNGFVILNDNNIFTGTNTSNLTINISNEMYNWTKWRFACQVDTSLYCNSFSEIYKLEVYPNYVNTNINEITNNNLELNYFPNPVVSNLNIESFDKITEIYIYSLDGILVSKINSKNYIETINFSKFDSGIYSIKVNSESGKTKRFKIINL